MTEFEQTLLETWLGEGRITLNEMRAELYSEARPAGWVSLFTSDSLHRINQRFEEAVRMANPPSIGPMIGAAQMPDGRWIQTKRYMGR